VGTDEKTGKHLARLRIDYTSSCDAPTPLCITNHAYFNLSGEGACDVLCMSSNCAVGSICLAPGILYRLNRVGDVTVLLSTSQNRSLSARTSEKSKVVMIIVLLKMST